MVLPPRGAARVAVVAVLIARPPALASGRLLQVLFADCPASHRVSCPPEIPPKGPRYSLVRGTPPGMLPTAAGRGPRQWPGPAHQPEMKFAAGGPIRSSRKPPGAACADASCLEIACEPASGPGRR